MTPCTTCAAALNGRCLGALPDQPTVTEHVADGVAVMRIEIASVATLVPQHVHEWAHLTMLERGAVRVFRDDAGPSEYTAPAAIVIPAHVPHLFETLTDGVVLLCIHNTARAGSIDVADEHQIEGA